MSDILVFGHRNPDNDSVSSAVAYAYLMNQIDPDNTYVPARLGPMPRETSFVFGQYGIETPRVITHVRRRVRDAMTPQVITVSRDATLLEAGRLFRERKFKCMPVTDGEGKFVGVISLHELAGLFVAETDVTGFTNKPVKVADLVKSFSGEVVLGDPEAVLNGKFVIAASEPADVAAMVAPGDIVIIGNRLRSQPAALEAGASCMIITCGAEPRPEIVERARELGTVLLTTSYDTYTVARFASLSQKVGDYMSPTIDLVSPDDLLADAAEKVYDPPHDEAVVIDDDGQVCGILTQGDVSRSKKLGVILVDHNEKNQTAPGIDDARIVGIVDHQRIGDLETSGPITFLNEPVGSTATIITSQFQIRDVEIPKPIAAVLLSAIMTDTVVLKSPTTTYVDRHMAQYLGEILGRDPQDFGIEVIQSRGTGEKVDIGGIIGADAKDYEVGDDRVCIAQHETVNLKAVLEREDEIRAAMEKASIARSYDMYLLLVTDIMAEGSQFIVVGNTRLVERAFGISLKEGSVFVPGILSRKKQVVGRIMDARS